VVDPALYHLTKTIGGELLEDVPHFPFTGGDPFSVRRRIHGFEG
jgi:hypothetical protein